MRLTPEREKEIRKHIKTCTVHHEIANELLSEIDALRADRDSAIQGHFNMEGHLKTVINERNQLNVSLEQACNESHAINKQRKGYRDLLEQCRQERDTLKAENEKLKTNQVFEASCTHLFNENEALRNNYNKLSAETEKLRKRAQFLRRYLLRYACTYCIQGGPGNRITQCEQLDACIGLANDDVYSKPSTVNDGEGKG